MEKKSACYIVFFFCTGFWSFLYGVGFIYLASQWTKTTDSSPAVLAAGNNMRAAIAFSFFSVFTWVHNLNQQFLMIFKTAEFNCFIFFMTIHRLVVLTLLTNAIAKELIRPSLLPMKLVWEDLVERLRLDQVNSERKTKK